MPLERDDIDRLIRCMEETGAEVHTLWQAIDEARTDIVNELRNLVMPQQSPKTSEAEAESVACAFCDIDDPGGLAEALRQGWTRLQHDPKGLTANFLGVCPSCAVEQNAPANVPAEGSKAKGSLF